MISRSRWDGQNPESANGQQQGERFVFLHDDVGTCQDMSTPATKEGSGRVQTPEQLALYRGVWIFPKICPKGTAWPASHKDHP